MPDSSRLSHGEAFSFQPPLRVGIVGAGRVGRAFGAALLRRGHTISAVSARSEESVAAAARLLQAEASSNVLASRDVDLVVVAVPDDSLAHVASEIASSLDRRSWIVHTSGRSGAEVLAACGDRVAAIHPARPIPTGETSLEGVAFGVTCSDEAWPFASWLVKELGGSALRIAEKDRVLYHLGLVLASNFTSALAGDAAGLSGRDAVIPLLRATLENLEEMEPDEALTGPVIRGDADTIRLHLKEIETRAPHLRDAYVANSRRVLDRARNAKKISDEDARRIEDALP
ncbi:MAG: Rossmann-like and DUF2520 domain-containing protein [Actinomycetota bacterium]|nr:DUF2520 domain-containing protein [Actinomycetota bacterium]